MNVEVLSQPRSSPAEPAALESDPAVFTSKQAVTGLMLICSVAGLIALWGGPPLGQHEAIVAQIGRQTLDTGHWLVPYFLNMPFLVKPPLTPWAIAAFGRVLPPDHGTGLAVSAFAARLPSLISTVLTVWIVFLLARSMFSRRAAWMAAFVYATSIGAMIYAVNATAEALLTVFCTWAFAEFWWSRQAASAGGRRLHLVLFYLALGLAMFAKGPMPLSMVAMPIAVWWWCERPTRLLATGGCRTFGRSTMFALKDALPRLWKALTRLGLWWGIPLFLLCFVPWMILVGRAEPHAWDLWRYEYVDRIQNKSFRTADPKYWYYPPILFGLLIPWALSFPEALASPFLSHYRRHRKALTYAWYWVIVGVAIMTAMSFKKPYYLLPALPGCAILLAPVLERFFLAAVKTPSRKAYWTVGVIVGVLVVGLTVGWFVMNAKYHDMWHGTLEWGAPLCGAVAVIGFALAGVLYLRGRRPASFCLVGGTAAATFLLIWCVLGPNVGDVGDPLKLAREMEKAGIPESTPLYWISNRPDARTIFYGQRKVRQVEDPDELASGWGGGDASSAKLQVASKVDGMLREPRTHYFLFDREQFETFKMFFKPPARILLDVDRGKLGKDDDDWVVITNEGVPRSASGPRNAPGSST